MARRCGCAAAAATCVYSLRLRPCRSPCCCPRAAAPVPAAVLGAALGPLPPCTLHASLAPTIDATSLDAPPPLQEAGNLSILFDVGGVLGGTIAGWLSGERCPGVAARRACLPCAPPCVACFKAVVHLHAHLHACMHARHTSLRTTSSSIRKSPCLPHPSPLPAHHARPAPHPHSFVQTTRAPLPWCPLGLSSPPSPSSTCTASSERCPSRVCVCVCVVVVWVGGGGGGGGGGGPARTGLCHLGWRQQWGGHIFYFFLRRRRLGRPGASAHCVQCLPLHSTCIRSPPPPSAQRRAVNIALMMTAGFFVNGPYALITTAVSADLGTHKSLAGGWAGWWGGPVNASGCLCDRAVGTVAVKGRARRGGRPDEWAHAESLAGGWAVCAAGGGRQKQARLASDAMRAW